MGGGTRIGDRFGRYLPGPCALADSKWDAPAAGLCSVLLAAVFVTEIASPRTVVGALAWPPLLAANWMLSRRSARVVLVVGVLLFITAALIEGRNRLTIVILGGVVVLFASVTRLYATTLAQTGASLRVVGAPRILPEAASLTARELDVARLGAEGCSAAEIGVRLHIGERTVETHLANTYSKLGIHSRLQLIRMASKLGSG